MTSLASSRLRPSWDETWMAEAKIIAQRSLCSRDQVGAVVVDRSNRIVDTGYNGPPAGFNPRRETHAVDPQMPCHNWCPRAAYSDWIHNSAGEDCPSIVDDNAFHGPQKDYSDCPALHAEANALMFSDRRLREGGTIYVSSGTCGGCAKLVANSGLIRAVYAPTQRADGAPHRDSDRWYDFLRDCGLEVTLV